MAVNAKNEAKIKFTAETQAFTKEIQQINSSMSALRAGLQLNEAEFKNTGDRVTYLQNKDKLLVEQLQRNIEKQEALEGKLQAAKDAYGENSKEVQDWQTKLTRAQIEEQKLTTELKETTTELNTLEAELNEGTRDMQELGDAAEEAGKDADGAARGGWTTAKSIIADLASQAIQLLISKLKEAAKAVVDLGMEFTASMSNVQALSGASAREMGQLEAVAKELGRSTIFSASQVSDAFGYMALAGWDVQDMLSGIDGVLNLAASAQMDLAQASDIVTDYLTAFGLSAEDSGKFVDQMAFAMSHSNTDVEQLGEAYKNVAATAGSLGYSVEETTAALMTMANAGVKGGEAGTGLSTIMTRLATDTKGCADKLSEYGVNVYDAEGSMNSLSSILNGTAEIWGDLTDQQQANLAKTIAGTSQYSKFQTIMNGLSDAAAESGQSFNDYTEALENCTGSAEDMTAIMNDNLSGDMKALGSAAEGLGLQIFSFFEDDLRGAAQLATDAINAVTDYLTPTKTELQTFIEEIQGSNAAVQASIDNARGSMDSMYASIGELEAYKDIMLELNSKTELTEFEHYQLQNAVEALSGTIPGLADAYDEVNGKLNLTNGELEDMFTNAEKVAVQNAILKAQSDAYDALAEAIVNAAKADSAYEKAQEDLEAVSRKNKETVDESTNVYGDYWNEVITAQQTVESARKAQEAANKAMEDAQGVIDETAGAYDKLSAEYGLTEEKLDSVTEKTEEAAGAAEEAKDAVEGTGQLTEEELEAAEEAVKKLTEAYEDMRDGIRDSIASSISFLDEFNGGTEITAEEISQNLQSQIEGISNWSSNMQRLAAEVGTSVSQEMYDSLVQMGPDAANLVQELINTLDNDTDQFNQIASQWTEAMNLTNDAELLAGATQVGKDFAAGVGEGFSDGEADLVSTAQTVTKNAAKSADLSDMTKAAEAAKTEVKKRMEEASDEVTKNFGKMRSTASSEAAGMASDLESNLNNIPSTTARIMAAALASVQAYLGMMRSALATTIQGPRILTPHFSLNGRFDLQSMTVPTVTIDWYKNGAIFTKPTILATPEGFKGVGEAGAEAVLPIDMMQGYIEDAIDRNVGTTINVEMNVSGADSPEAWASRFIRQVNLEARMA